MKCAPRRLHGFTLIELLVMIFVVIIGVLAMMLLTGRLGHRERVTPATCRYNLYNIGKACFLYSEQNAEFYPYWESTRATDSLALLYPELLPVAQTFRCMSTKDRPAITVTNGPPRTAGCRSFGTSSPSWSSFGYDKEIGRGKVDAMTPIAADMDGSSVANGGARATSNHAGGQNVLFYDTHVEWRSMNTWVNAGQSDNIYIADLGGGDSDSFIRR